MQFLEQPLESAGLPSEFKPRADAEIVEEARSHMTAADTVLELEYIELF